MKVRTESIEKRVQALLEDAPAQGSPLHDALDELWQTYREQINRIERITRLSDTYQTMAHERELSLAERFDKQVRQLQKLVRISDHYQDMVRDLNNRLKEAATHDALTGLTNRGHGEAVLAQEQERSHRYGTPLTLIMFDIDNFKQVNDQFGHAYGDMVLKAITHATLGRLREADLLVRWGGEEFLVIAPHTDIDSGLAMAEKIRQVIAKTPIPGSDAVTVSLGVAALAPEETPDAILARVDKALYGAKHAGRNCVLRASEAEQ